MGSIILSASQTNLYAYILIRMRHVSICHDDKPVFLSIFADEALWYHSVSPPKYRCGSNSFSKDGCWNLWYERYEKPKGCH
jgi:hypothetical protein